MRSQVSCWILSLLLLPSIRAALKNVTIDDTFGDWVTGALPTYVPDPWEHQDYSECAILPPLTHVFKQTYSAYTFNPEKFPSMSIQFSFQGSAIYVFFILPNFVNTGITTETFCNFTLDGNLVSTFHHVPSTSRDYIFNALVFSKDDLPGNNTHTLFISTSGLNRNVFTSFDYAVYQFDDNVDGITASQQSPTKTPDQTAVTVSPQTSTTIVSGTSAVTTIMGTLTRSESTTLTSSNSIFSSSPSSPFSANVITSGTLGTVRATSSLSLSSSTSSSQSSTNVNDNDTTHSAPIGAISGGVVGGVAVIFLLILVIFLCRRRRQARMDLPSNTDEPTPRHPVLIPFTSTASGNPNTEGGGQEERLLFTQFTPARKQQRDTAQMRELEENSQSPAANELSSSSSEILLVGAQDRSMISEQINSLKKKLDRSSSSASGALSRFGGPGEDMAEIVRQNQAMKAEIERLQAQLNSDQALWLTNEAPPGYSRYAADIHPLSSSAVPVTAA